MNLKRETEDKKPPMPSGQPVSDEKKSSILSKDSVKLFGESAGFSDLSDGAATLLAQDVSYRLRDVVQSASQYMKHSKRKKLTTADFNKALKNNSVEPLYGYGSDEPMLFQSIKDADIHVVEDVNLNVTSLSQKSYAHQRSADPYLKAQWLAVEGVQKNLSLSGSGKTVEVKQGALPEDLSSYYDSITQALLGNDDELIKIALTDLRTNSRLSPLLAHFCSFVANGVKTVNYDVSQLTKLMYTVHSLVRNPALYLLHHPYLTLLVQAVTVCLVEPIAMSGTPSSDHWILRDYSAYLLAFITRECETPTNKLYSQNVLSLQAILCDDNRPFCSHYGAIRGLTLLGSKAVEDVLFNYLDSYMSTIQSSFDDMSVGSAQIKVDANSVFGALMMAAGVLLNGDFTECPENGPNTHAAELKWSETYSKLFSYFGDRLLVHVPYTEIIRPTSSIPSPKVCFSDNSSRKTGEELLEQFLHYPGNGKNGNDEDIDVDEKSESKSYRSGNSEDTAFVKSSVTDPAKGIKLTISMKRPHSGGTGGRHKKRKFGHKQTPKDNADSVVPLFRRKPIVFPRFKNRKVKSRSIDLHMDGSDKLGKFRMLSFSKSIIGKRKCGTLKKSSVPDFSYNLKMLL